MSGTTTPDATAGLGFALDDLQSSAALVRRAIRTSQAVPEAIKALFTAAAATNRGFTIEAAEEFASAKSLGASDEELLAVPNVLLSSRGEGMSRRAMRALITAVPELEHSLQTSPVTLAEGETPISMADAITIVTGSESGALLPQSQIMRDRVPDALLGYALGRDAAWHRNGIPPKYVHLMLVCVNAADFLPQYVERHGRMALDEGATTEEIVEAVLCAMPFGGVTSWFTSAASIPTSEPETHEPASNTTNLIVQSKGDKA